MGAAVVPVILSGGSGTRLWPMSRELRPKQFLPLVGERTMLQQTHLRTLALDIAPRPPIVVCNEAHRFLVAEQMREIGAPPQTIVLEPQGRNTAPAVAVAAWLALRQTGDTRATVGGSAAGDSRAAVQNPADPLLLVLPADHMIGDPQAFARAVAIALEAARGGNLVTFGVVPNRPETGYGYIRIGQRHGGGWHALERFVEKPSRSVAENYVESGAYAWNSGMFVFSARRYLEELERHAPEIAVSCERAAAEAVADADFTRLGPAFSESPSDSIDYAVMEKTQRAAVVPLDAAWNDIGSWQALHEVLAKDEAGNVVRGDVILDGCRNSYIAASHRLVAAVGVEGHVIVETEDAVLIVPHEAVQDVKKVVDALKAAARKEK